MKKEETEKLAEKKTPKTGRNWMILKETGRNRNKQKETGRHSKKQ